LLGGIRDSALVVLTEPAVSILRDGFVNVIPNRRRNNFQAGKKLPDSSQVVQCLKNSGRLFVNCFVLGIVPSDVDDAIKTFRISSMSFQHPMTGLSLKLGKEKNLRGIPSKQEIHGAIAEDAFAVVKDEQVASKVGPWRQKAHDINPLLSVSTLGQKNFYQPMVNANHREPSVKKCPFKSGTIKLAGVLQ
jgi:hypothetical protein